jgi:hypothetical protein
VRRLATVPFGKDFGGDCEKLGVAAEADLFPALLARAQVIHHGEQFGGVEPSPGVVVNLLRVQMVQLSTCRCPIGFSLSCVE